MAEPTVTQQIQTAISGVYGAIAYVAGQLGMGLRGNLPTNGYEIQGAALDENDYAPPMVLRSYSDMDLISASGTRIHNALLPNLSFVSPPSSGVISEAYNGNIIAPQETTPLALILDPEIPAPDGNKRWWCMIFNEGDDVVGLTSTGVTVNGAFDEVQLAAKESRMVSRGPSGFVVM